MSWQHTTLAPYYCRLIVGYTTAAIDVLRYCNEDISRCPWQRKLTTRIRTRSDRRDCRAVGRRGPHAPHRRHLEARNGFAVLLGEAPANGLSIDSLLAVSLDRFVAPSRSGQEHKACSQQTTRHGFHNDFLLEMMNRRGQYLTN